MTTPMKQLYRSKFNPDKLQSALPSFPSVATIRCRSVWTSGVDEIEGCEDGDEVRKMTSLKENIEKHSRLSTNNVYVQWSRGQFGDEPDY
ncbi:hypothetical protein Tco_0456546 [Tanacetum coccineum]